MESFFGTLKTELLPQRDCPDRDAARHDLFAYLKGYYNRQPIHSAIGSITPEQADRKTAQPGAHSSGGRSVGVLAPFE
jgi:putative transposase